MTDEKFEKFQEAARELGRSQGKDAASWWEINSQEAAVATLRGIEEGDPEVLDSFPGSPLSGEWAGDMTPGDVMKEIGCDPEATLDIRHSTEDDYIRAQEAEGELATAFEDGWYSGYHDALVKRLHYHIERKP